MIICEIGLNHLGEKDYADEYINAILKSNADALIFQVREESFYLKKPHLRLTEFCYGSIFEKVKAGGKKFGIALADVKSVDFFSDLGADFYKVLSKDIMNFPLIDKLLGAGKPIFFSTGMSNLEEIKKLVRHIRPAKERVSLIHTQLSHDIKDVNLAAITFLREKFNLPVAFGSHSPNPNVLLLALAYGPSDIFFYIKGWWTNAHPDEEHAIKLSNLNWTVDNLKELPFAIGSETKIKMGDLININQKK